jgi:hypothetical protein
MILHMGCSADMAALEVKPRRSGAACGIAAVLSKPVVVTIAGATRGLTIANINKPPGAIETNASRQINRMSDAPAAVSAGATLPQPDSPFLPSHRSELPKLAQIQLPIGARVEFEQQMTSQIVDLPINRLRTSMRVHALKPSPQCPPAFVYAFNSFCSARRAMSTACVAEGEAMLASETRELIAHSSKETGKHGSLPPRNLCISLVIPQTSSHNDGAIRLIDGMAALSDMKLADGTPIATKVRFSIYGGPAELPVSKLIMRDAFDRKSLDSIGLVVRWAQKEGSTSQPRTECMSLGATAPLPGEESRVLQMAVVKLETAFGFELPTDFFLDPPVSKPAYYEKQIIDCSLEFHKLLHVEDPFTPSELMLKNKSGLLRRVPGCFARITPIARQLQGVTSSDAMHAVLLCSDGMQEKALEYAKIYREGLRPPEGEDKLLDLHTAAIQVERLYLNGMVSLYAQGGKSGEPLKPDGNWVYKTKAAIVPIKTVMANFFVMSCAIESMIPGNRMLLRYMDVHMEKCSRVYDTVFAKDDLQALMCRSTSPTIQMTQQEVNDLTTDERFSLSAMGVDLKSSRMFIGDAISYLMHNGAPKALLELLTYASMKVGLRSSLQDGFASCCGSLKMKDASQEREVHAQEVERLKRVADAALVLGCNKRACYSVADTKPEKVRVLMNSLCLKPGKHVARLDDFVSLPRRTTDVRRLAAAAIECYARKYTDNNVHFDQICLVLESYKDIYLAISKAVSLCMVKPYRRKDAFLIIHGHDMASVSVNEVMADGSLCPCGIGKVFELDRPCVAVLKMRSDVSCILTPLVVM